MFIMPGTSFRNIRQTKSTVSKHLILQGFPARIPEEEKKFHTLAGPLICDRKQYSTDGCTHQYQCMADLFGFEGVDLYDFEFYILKYEDKKSN